VALPRRGGRARYRLALLVLTALTLLTLDFRSFGPLDRVQTVARDGLAPIRSAVLWAVSPVGDAIDGVFDYGDLEDENARLRAELDELRGAQLADEAAAEELDRLKEALDLPGLAGVERQVARIVAGPAGNFDEHRVEIDKGSSSGLQVGMAVMTNAGLVGRIAEVDTNRARVQLASSPAFAVGVRVGGEVALARGTGSPTELRAAEGLSIDNPAETGEPVVTNGGQTSTVPAEVPVGRVGDVDPSSGSLAVTIELTADVENLDYVAVLLYTPEPVVAGVPG
jgi:rod shape-determining protein MreC